MVLPIVVYGHPVLRKVAADIEYNPGELSRLLGDLWDTMYNADGVGLAAPQVGLSLRVFVVDGTSLSNEYPELDGFKKAFINPGLTLLEGEKLVAEEGCLSVPGIREDVARHARVKISYLNENFEKEEGIYEGFAARIIQHEYDHLEGKFFMDYLSPLRKRLMKSKLNAIINGNVTVDYAIKLPG